MFFQIALYNLFISIYFYLIYVASFFNKKAQLWIEGRKVNIIPIAQNSIWFHCASLGEFEQARPLINKVKLAFPDHKIVLTFFSPSGYEIRKNYKKADYIYYLPLDTQKNAQLFIEKIKPELVFFIKYEFWYHYLDQLKKRKIKTYLISGIFRKNQIFFKFYGSLFRKMLSHFTHLFVQDSSSQGLLNNIKIEQATQINDTRFDQVIQVKMESKEYPDIQNFVGNKPCIVIGSSWSADERLIQQSINKLSKYKLIIAPHEISHSRINEVQQLFPDSILYSEIENYTNQNVLIINNIGMLSSIYKYGEIAYIGGGFGESIHNILEAAVYGLPVIFGPAHLKMREASALIELKAGFEINNLDDLYQILDYLSQEETLKNSGLQAKKYVEENIGGSKKILEYIKKEKNLV